MSKLGNIYEKFPSNVLADALKGAGIIMRTAGNNVVGHQLNNMIHRNAAKLIIRFYEIAGLNEDRSAVDVISEFMEYFFGDDIDIEAISEDEVVITFDECPYGFCDGGHAELCAGVKILEDAIVEYLNGELVIEEHRIEGADVCRLRIRNV